MPQLYFSTFLRQLSDGLGVVFEHIPHRIAECAKVGKARGRRCIVLLRVCRDTRGEIEREDPRRIVLAVPFNDAADDSFS